MKAMVATPIVISTLKIAIGMQTTIGIKDRANGEIMAPQAIIIIVRIGAEAM